jgi:hypothetical protein
MTLSGWCVYSGYNENFRDKSEREFLNYIKVGKEETVQNLSKHPYFMGTTLKIAN